MRVNQEPPLNFSRRALLHRAGLGIGTIALAALMDRDVNGGTAQSLRPHFAPRAKRVIFLHMVGAPSQLDLFDNKPVLRKHDGQLVPKHLIEGQRFAFLRGHPKLLGSRFAFRRHGTSGLELSEALPHLSTVADEIAVIKTLQSDEFNHAPAQLFMQTGFGQFGRPCLGAWVSYGLGSENENLPGFVVLNSNATAGAGNSLWGNGFLPSLHQGIEFRNSGDPVLFLSNPKGITAKDRRRIVDSVRTLNQVQLADVGDPEIATRIAQYELAFRMQTSVPDLTDISKEPQSVHEAYGTSPGKASFANHCLLSRRLVERGVRFVLLCNSGWDHHNNVFNNLRRKCGEVDRPVAALILDLKQRGLLDDTLVVWGGEFGRTPMLQPSENNRTPGRDHHKDASTIWMAGGGVKGGTVYGRTDELGYLPVENRTHINDFHATVLRLLGIDHELLTFKFQGRDFRLTDVSGDVIHDVIS